MENFGWRYLRERSRKPIISFRALVVLTASALIFSIGIGVGINVGVEMGREQLIKELSDILKKGNKDNPIIEELEKKEIIKI